MGIQHGSRCRLGIALLLLLEDELLAVDAVPGNVCWELFPDVLHIIAAVPGLPVFLQCKNTRRVCPQCDGNRNMAAAACFQAVIRNPVFLIKRPAIVDILRKVTPIHNDTSKLYKTGAGHKANRICGTVMFQNCLANSGLFFGERRGNYVRLDSDRHICSAGGTHRNTIQSQHRTNVVDIFRILHHVLRDHITGNRVLPRDHKNIFVFDVEGR